MMRRALAASVLATLCVTGSAFAQLGPAVSEQAARDAADTVARHFESTYNARSSAGVADLFAKDGVYLAPGGTILTNRRSIEQAIAGRMKAGWTKAAITVFNAHPAGDSVWVIGEYVTAGSGQNSGKETGGYYAEVLTRERPEWRLSM
jgi:ketosteroid isomerase-like protein